MKIAIIYTSKSGTTESVARQIAGKMTAHSVALFNLAEKRRPDLNLYDGVILGSSIYAGKPRAGMNIFCRNNLEKLKELKLALFVCGMEKDEIRQSLELASAYPEELLRHSVARQFAGGEIFIEKKNRLEKFILKRFAKITTSESIINTEAINTLAKAFDPKHPK
jgi:menaquinone-dependent protoporphyrinogen oxidase